MKNFFKNPIETLSNAAEINTLKERRERLRGEKKDVEDKIMRYNEQNELKVSVSKLMEPNTEALVALRTLFTKGNVDYKLPYDEFIETNHNTEIQHYKQLYDDLMKTQSTITKSLEHLNTNVCVDINTYKQTVTNLDGRIEEINERLRKVRDKQYK